MQGLVPNLHEAGFAVSTKWVCMCFYLSCLSCVVLGGLLCSLAVGGRYEQPLHPAQGYPGLLTFKGSLKQRLSKVPHITKVPNKGCYFLCLLLSRLQVALDVHPKSQLERQLWLSLETSRC